MTVCYCDSLVSVDNSIKVTIIQHPLEEKHPFNTGRMAHLCLKRSEIIVTEVIDETLLAECLGNHSVLLYPDLEWLPKFKGKKATNGAITNKPIEQIEQLVVIDATWRKSKKILYLNQALQNLPRLSLQAGNPSAYSIRKSSFEDSLSTVESITAALEILEAGKNFSELLKPFQRMIELQKQKQ